MAEKCYPPSQKVKGINQWLNAQTKDILSKNEGFYALADSAASRLSLVRPLTDEKAICHGLTAVELHF